LKMKERKITHINKINPMIDNIAIKGRITSVWHSHKLNEQHDPYSLDCVFQDEEMLLVLVVAIGNIIPVNGYGCSKICRTVMIEDAEWKISLYKGSEIKRIEQIDENFIGFVNEPFTRILDPNNRYHEHDSVAIGNIIPVNGYGCSKICRTVMIEDSESLRLECTFWDN
nr:hypothetical protein [Tanacetum cinerariifolium]